MKGSSYKVPLFGPSLRPNNYLARFSFIQVQTSQRMRDERLSQTSTLNQLVRDRSSKEYAYASLLAPGLSTHHISGCLESRYSFIAAPARVARAHISVHSCIRLELGEVRLKG